MGMLDRVLDRLVGRHRHVLQLLGRRPGRGQPAPQRSPERAQRGLVAEDVELEALGAVRQRAQDEQRHVVVVGVGPQHRVHDVVAQRAELGRPFERGRAQPSEALVGVLAALLDQPVGVDEQRRARLEIGARGRVRRVLQRAQRRAAAADQVRGLAVRADDQRRRVAGGGVLEPRRRRIDHGQEHGRHVVPCHRELEAVEVVQERGGIALQQRIRAHRASELAHRRGGGDAAPGDVADDQQQLAGRQRDSVIPVPAHLGPRAAGQVPRRGEQARQQRQRLG